MKIQAKKKKVKQIIYLQKKNKLRKNTNSMFMKEI